MTETLHNKIPEWRLERFRLGELPESEMAKIRQQLVEDPAMQRQLEALERDSCEILRRYPAEVYLERIRQRANPEIFDEKSRYFQLFSWRLAYAALPLACGLLLWLSIPEPHQIASDNSRSGLEQTTIKGLRPRLLAYQQHGAVIEPLRPGSVSRRGDRVQLGYVAAGQSYGCIFSLDGRGAVTLHFPDHSMARPHLDPRGEVLLAEAYELDDAPNFEHFILVTANHPFVVDEILAIARKIGPVESRQRLLDSLPQDMTVDFFTLRKE
jgi:hypothetical protein